MCTDDTKLHCCVEDLQSVQSDLQPDLCQVATKIATGLKSAA